MEFYYLKKMEWLNRNILQAPFYIRVNLISNTYGENLIARCSQVHDNFTMGVNRKILINLIYLFIQETYLTCANGL